MPHYSRYGRGFRKRRGRFGGRRTFAKRARRIVRAAAEIKFVDQSVAVQPTNDTTNRTHKISASGSGTSTIPLNGVEIGSASNQRIGKKQSLRDITIRQVCEMTSSFGTVWPRGAMANFWLIWDKEPNGTLVVQDDIWNGPAFQSMRQHDKAGRFRMLKTWTMSMSPQVLCPCEVTQHVKLRGLSTEYFVGAAGGDVIGSINRGALWLFYNFEGIGDTAAATPGFSVTTNSRVTYTDA